METYWNAGRMIREHLDLNESRAKYGAELFPRLEADTGVGKRLLYRCAQFARCFPRRPIVSSRTQLTWGHYRAVLDIDSAAERRRLLALARKEHLTGEEFDARVRAEVRVADGDEVEDGGQSPGGGNNVLKPKRGKVGVFRLKDVKGGIGVDLGFREFLEKPMVSGFGLAARLRSRELRRGKLRSTDGQLVRVNLAGRVRRALGATKKHLFTYRAVVDRVVDGDTIWFWVELRPGQVIQEKIRLRGIDCPEIGRTNVQRRTPNAERRMDPGREAKRFVQEMVDRAEEIVITTTKPDKYDRYLCDVFLHIPEMTNDQCPMTNEVFLNGELLARGMAVVKREYELGDWDV